MFYVGRYFKTMSVLDGAAFLKFRVAKRLSFSLFLFFHFFVATLSFPPSFPFNLLQAVPHQGTLSSVFTSRTRLVRARPLVVCEVLRVIETL